MIAFIGVRGLRRTLSVALLATAREPSRYAINFILLEGGAAETRWAATDGRRLAIVEPEPRRARSKGKIIVPTYGAELLTELARREDEDVITVSIPKSEENQPHGLQFASSERDANLRLLLPTLPNSTNNADRSHLLLAPAGIYVEC